MCMSLSFPLNEGKAEDFTSSPSSSMAEQTGQVRGEPGRASPLGFLAGDLFRFTGANREPPLNLKKRV
jgi:hypothetical protein